MNRASITALVVALLALPVPAYAVDFSHSILQLDGTPMRIGDAEKGKIFTLADVAENALLADYRDETSLEPAEKLKRFTLAQKIEAHRAGGDLSLTADEIAMIKKLVGKAYNALVLGRVTEFLDPAAMPK